MAIRSAAVIGGGSFGTVIGNILADNGIQTTLWLRNEDAANEINDKHHNEQYLPGVQLNPELRASVSLQEAVTGADFTDAELKTTAARIVALKKAFNIREGWRPEQDTLPARFLSEGLPEGASRGARIPRARLQGMIRAYNVARRWNEDGTLPDAVMQELGLG